VEAWPARRSHCSRTTPRRAEFAAAARQRAVEHFDTSLIVPQYEAYYREVLGR